MTDSSDNEFDKTDSDEDHMAKIPDYLDEDFSSMSKSLSAASTNILLHFEDHLTFNVTSSVLKAICDTGHHSDYKPSSTITNYTGHEAQMRYTVLAEGKEIDLMKSPVDNDIDSSE